MDWNKVKAVLKKTAAVYWIAVVLIYLVAGQQFRYTAVTTDALSASTVVGEMTDEVTVRQRITVPATRLEGLSLLLGTYERENTGALIVSLEDEQGRELARQTLDISQVRNGEYADLRLDAPLDGEKGRTMTLAVTARDCESGNAVTLLAGNSVAAGRHDIAQNVPAEERYTLNGTAGTGRLCVKLHCVKLLSFYKVYWVLTAAVFAVALTLCVIWLRQGMAGGGNPLVTACTMYARYRFLLRQLVERDFKIKYKRSMLGMAWSILNPLMTMGVQYVVFSTIFKSDIENFPVYLLCGIVLFSFFNEAVSLGMMSITGNAALIKKVYIPKYIFPVSRVLSSLVNLVLSLIPLVLVMLITGTPFRPALILVVLDLLCLVMFVIGMVLLLCTAMTFFQDVQFLWGIASMLWMYLTPIFYPETIIPQNLQPLFRMNPMYQFISFARICILDGVSPEPMRYLWCMVCAVGMLLLGAWVFRKNQDKFVLYL